MSKRAGGYDLPVPYTLKSPQRGWARIGRVSTDSAGLVNVMLGRSRRIEWSEIAGFHVARPKGIWPGVTVIARLRSGREVALTALSVDVGFPSARADHQRLFEYVTTLEVLREQATGQFQA